MYDTRLRELRDRAEAAANTLAARDGWGGEGYRRAVRVMAAWWAWCERQTGGPACLEAHGLR